MATTRQAPPRKPSSVSAPSLSGQSSLLPLIVGCLFPLVATTLDIVRQALPFSLESVATVQLTQPLHWLIDLVPVVMLLLLSKKKKPSTRITTSTPRTQSPPGIATPPVTDQSAPQQKAITTLQAELASVNRQLEQTRTNEAALREMIENAADAILTIGVDGTVTSANRGAEQMLGWTRQEMVGQPISNLLTLASLPQMEAHQAEILTNPSASPICEVEFVHSNGRGLWAEGCTSVIRNSNGEATGLHIIYRNLSHRQQVPTGSEKTSVATIGQDSALSASQLNAPVSTALSFKATPNGAIKVPGLLVTPDQKTEATPNNKDQELTALNLTFQPESEPVPQTISSAPAQFAFTDEAVAEPQLSPATPTPLATDETAVEPPSPVAESVQFAFVDETEAATQTQISPSLPVRFSFADESETKLPVSPSGEQFLFTNEIPATAGASLFSSKETAVLDSSPFNYPEALSYIGGDEMLLAELAAIFLQEYPHLLENLRTAVVNNDVEALIYHAHALKGSVSNFVAADAENAARRLEQIGRDGNLNDAPKVLGELETALMRLAPALSNLAVQAAA